MGKIKKFCRRVVYGTALILGLNTISIPVAWFINRNMSYKENTLVFSSGKAILRDYGLPDIPSCVMTPIVDYFMYTPVTIRQNLKRKRVYWCSNPSLEKFADEIENPVYKNIILIGHGSKNSFLIYNGELFADYLACLPIPPRTGEFSQYTCGERKSNETLKDVLFKDCIRHKEFDGKVDPIRIYFSAWFD